MTLEEHAAGLAESATTDYAAADLARFFQQGQASFLEDYLAAAGRSKAHVLQALSARVASPALLTGQTWYRALASILRAPFVTASPACGDFSGLRRVLKPFVAWALESLIVADAGNEIAAQLKESLVEILMSQLGPLASKAAVLEVSIFSLRRVPAGAPAEPVERRYAEALERSPRLIQKFWLTYPALARLAATATVHWVENTQELLNRMARDRAAIELHFPALAQKKWLCAEATAGDLHDRGHQVLKLKFEDGSHLIYKPRPPRIDLGYQYLLRWLNERRIGPTMRLLEIIDRGAYGWYEYVEHTDLPRAESAADFYWRHGAHLALLYVLEGTDFHHENVIASGEHPVLVDLETLFHGIPKSNESDKPSPAQTALRTSVFTTGLLPGWSESDRYDPGPDLSGIGCREGQYYSGKIESLVRDAGGTLQVEWQRLMVGAQSNLPVFVGAAINPADYEEDVRRGFRAAYHAAMREADTLLQDEALWTLFERAPVRHVPTGTVVYSQLLRRSVHPDFLRRTVHRELLFASLASRIRYMPHSAALLNSEIKALLNGNVPKFMTTPMETSLHDEDGERLENYLPEPGAATARGRLRRLSPENLESQDRIVALGMSSLRRKGEAGARSAPPEPIPTEPLGRGEIENEIAALADRLCELVITEGDRHDWIGIVQDEQGGAHVRAAGADLYDGGAGIGLFLGFAAAEFNNSRWKRVSANCAEQIAETLQAPILNLGGAFIGGTSRAFALLHYASLFDRPDWSDLAIRRLLEATPLVRRDRLFDIVAGAAGYAAVLLAAYVRTGETALLDAAVTATEHLVSAQVVTEKGTGWPARNSSVPLTGFSHGAAGIGWSLVHIGHLAGRDDLVARGKAAFAYERSVATARGWPDFRNIPGETGPTFALAWCHGAPGIGLSRATLPLQLCGIAEEGEIARSVSAIETSPLAGTDCLCHGELGNLETLTAAGRRMSDSKIGLVAKRRASAAVLRARARGWRCGIAADVVTPGLMTGLAGIGYGLMRTFEIGEVPSLLRIEGPTKAGFRR